MFVSHLSCPKCRATYEPNRKIQLCTCGSPLLVGYDLKKAGKALTKESLPQRRNDLWRYRELLPVRDFKNIVTLGEGMTPLLRLRNIGGQWT